MRKISTFILLAFLFGIIFTFSYAPARAQAIKALSYNPCDTPIEYKIGEIDEDFNLTKQQVLGNVQTASSIWSKAEGKQLFTHSDDAKLTINFKYDSRSALISKINEQESKLDSQNETLQKQIEEHKADVERFEKELDDLNSTIERYNSQGGAPSEEVYNDLINRQNHLKAKAIEINDRAKQLNLETRDYNSDVKDLRQDVNQFNNALNQKPEEGLYDPLKNEITIYFATDKNELVHTLAHEFGHVLGMEHVSDPKAIMYSFSTPSLTLTTQDKEELTIACQDQLLFSLWANRLNQWINNSSQSHSN